MAIKLDYESVSQITENSNQAVVYGFQHCRYTQVTEALKNETSPIKKIFDCSIGGPFADISVMTTLEGRKLEQVRIPNLDRHDVVRELKQYCKAGLVNIIIENIKREKEGKPIIPVLFVTDIEENTHPIRSETIASKENTFVTMGELRRAYKLCHDPNLHLQVREMAQKTFKFVKVGHLSQSGVTEYYLSPIAPFWMALDWEKAWDHRKVQSTIKPNQFWRQFLNRIAS